MKITLREDVTQFLLDRFRAGERPGIHLSDLLLCLRKAWYRKKGLAPGSDEDVVYWITGKGYHAILEEEAKEVELEKDGIIGTIDALKLGEPGRREILPIEVKSTRKSSARGLEDSPWWLEQLKGYCHLLGVRKGRLTVLHLMGDYRERAPKILTWDLEFTQDELEENWRWLLRRKEVLERALEEDRPPEGPREDWECGSCSIKLCEKCEKKEGR